jgi:hypothetical protein
MGEREPRSERPGRGELLCLYHPGTIDTFSGYGLVMDEDHPEHLVGLLMVDRPHPADPAWLQHIFDLYQECNLAPMTARGERGLVCQMIIHPDSFPHLRRYPAHSGLPIQEALEPLLDAPPAPALLLYWDDEQRLWFSTPSVTNELPEPVREVFEQSGYGCLALESTIGIVHVCHASDDDIAGFHERPVSTRWELIEMPTAPLVRLAIHIHDDPVEPFLFESFLHVGEPDQLQVLAELAAQPELILAFYGDDLRYRYAWTVPHSEQQWQQLDGIISRAEAYWTGLPPDGRDFNQAKELYMRVRP